LLIIPGGQIAIGIAPPFAARVVVILLVAQESLTLRLTPPLAHLAEREQGTADDYHGSQYHRAKRERTVGSGTRKRRRPFGGRGGSYSGDGAGGRFHPSAQPTLVAKPPAS
jgi:hypothetical protein